MNGPKVSTSGQGPRDDALSEPPRFKTNLDDPGRAMQQGTRVELEHVCPICWTQGSRNVELAVDAEGSVCMETFGKQGGNAVEWRSMHLARFG